MFARSHRFSFKKGAPRNVYQTPFFVIRYDHKNEGSFECAVVVGKKVDKRAVVRNKIKRQMVVCIKELVPATTASRFVIYAKKSILETTIEAKKEELKKAFEIIKITQ